MKAPLGRLGARSSAGRRRWSIALLLGAAACGRSDAKKTSDDAERAAHGVPLATVIGSKLEAPAAHVRVIVVKGGIDVDDAALVAAWPDEARGRLGREARSEDGIVFRHAGLIRLDGFRFLPPIDASAAVPDLPALRSMLAHTADLERRATPSSGGEGWSVANVIAASDAPYRVVRAVIAAALKSEYAPALVVRAGDHDAVLRLVTPESEGANAAPRREHLASFAVRVEAGGASLRVVDERIEPATLRGRSIVLADRACPPVGRTAARVDRSRLVLVLAQVCRALQRTDACDVVGIDAEPQIPWQDVADVLDAAADAGFDGAEPVDVASGCDDPVTADRLTPGSADEPR